MARKKTSTSNTSEIAKIITAQELDLKKDNEIELSKESFAQYVRALHQNWRQGTVACKDRSEVSFSNKKPWKQKGTGRARAGSARSPLWRKGGVTFGPQERTRNLNINKDVKRKVNAGLLWQYLNSNNIFSLNWNLQEDKPKTALANKALVDSGLKDKKIILFVSQLDHNIHFSFANIHNVRIMLFDQANAYDLADSNCWVFLEKDANEFKEMVGTWI